MPNATLPNAPSSDEVTSREIDQLDKPRLLHKTEENMDFILQLKNSAPYGNIYLSIRFPHASLPSGPSSNEVTSREIDDFDKPRLLRETDEKMDFIQQLKI